MRRQGNGVCRRGGFSLVELLTVIFIIALLIGILIPSLNAARNAAKKSSSQSMLKSVGAGLELFKNDNGSEFPQTHGYPPSFSYPPLTAFNNFQFDPHVGEFPFLENKPRVYGAHWLPAMLMGVDQRGFIKKSAVPKKSPPVAPDKWYTTEGNITERAPMYVTPENAPTKRTVDLTGRRPDSGDLFPSWDWNDGKERFLPVFVDAWEQPFLYYAANTAGRATNMVEIKRDPNNAYSTGDQGKGPPFYFHQDNEGFTGKSDSHDPNSGEPGWDFGTTGGKHAIKFHGAELTADKLIEPDNKESFAHFVVDRKIYSNLASMGEQGTTIEPTTPLRPVNADTFLLISPGVDGRYGTNDDVSNVPAFESLGS